MPELPEVQTIVNDLNKKIKGDLVVDFWTDWGKAIKNITTKDFKKSIKNKKVIKASRIGKNIFIELSGGKTLYIHLKMTGHLLVKTQETRYKIQTKDQTTNNNVELRGNNVALRKFQTKIQNSKSKILKNKENYFEDRVNQYIHHVFYLSKSGKEEFDSEYSESN